jgi:hypothetical protein
VPDYNATVEVVGAHCLTGAEAQSEAKTISA